MRFIVIEGLDGSGKSTQIKLLSNYLERRDYLYKYLHFPRTESPVYGELIARFLRGDFGKLEAVHPYLVALIYAGDRNDAKELINGWLRDDHYVIADRYVNSNIAFQCAKLGNKREREELKNWILHLEYDYHKIPQPDISLFLDVPFNFTEKKLTVKRTGDDRRYLNGQMDIHEQSLEFQKRVRDMYLEITQSDPKFIRIDCNNGADGILPQEEIFERIIDQLKI
ncbi:MAG: thymidylate kinase [Bacteroides sp. SM23_62_1]|nr:MAG: thymidylate kinase [Bacteroides sp. SM23_62_1]